MKLLYSNILPLGCDDEQTTIIDCFEEQIKNADRVEIAVGYTSNASISELEALADKYATKQICLADTTILSTHPLNINAVNSTYQKAILSTQPY